MSMRPTASSAPAMAMASRTTRAKRSQPTREPEGIGTVGRISIHKLKDWKAQGHCFAMITAYDYPSARLVEQAGIPVILVGDSLGSVVLGYDSTVPVTMEDVVYHTRAVVRATEKAIVVADMPFMSYQADPNEAMRNAGRMLKEGGATAVKLEGG